MRTPFRILTTLLVAATLAILGTTAQAQVGITAVPFLQIEPDSRAAGMGSTGVAIADNANAIFWNPAGLAWQHGNQISITHASWLPAFNADLFYDYLVGKYHIEGIGTVGGHITFLNLGEQIRTDNQGIEQGRFNSYELAAGLSYGYEVNENLAVGTGLRFIYSSLADGDVGGQKINPGTTVGLDLASLYRSDAFVMFNRNAHLKAGLSISNIGPGVQYTDNAQKDPLPTVLRIGGAYTTDLDRDGINRLTLATDLSKVMARTEMTVTGTDTTYEAMSSFGALFGSWNSLERFNGSEMVELGLLQQFMVGVGAEYWYNNQFALRTGYYYEHPENGNREYISLGAGLRYNMFGVDFSYIYALEDDHPLANTMRFSVLLNF